MKSLNLKVNFILAVFSILIFIAPTINLFAQEISVDEALLQKRRAIKIEFFSPLSGNTTVTYEQHIKGSLLVEASLGFIGAGTDISGNNDVGFLLKAGPKLLLNPSFVTDDLRRRNILEGAYFKPQISFSTYWLDEQYYDWNNSSGNTVYDYTRTMYAAALILNIGKQWVIADMITLDIYGGLGYGFSAASFNFEGNKPLNFNPKEWVNWGGYHFSHVDFGSTFPLALNGGFALGFAF